MLQPIRINPTKEKNNLLEFNKFHLTYKAYIQYNHLDETNFVIE